jgi:ankyrin repeat protein
MKRTGLHVAAEYDQVDAVKLLLEAGADPNIRDEDGDTALLSHLNCYDNPLLVRALIQAGADVNIKNNMMSTPLHYTDSEACALMLIEAGADINAVNIRGHSPLGSAIFEHRTAVEGMLRRFKALELGP